MWLFKLRGFRIYCLVGVLVTAIVLAVSVLLCSLDEQLLNSELILSAILSVVAGALWPITLLLWLILSLYRKRPKQ